MTNTQLQMHLAQFRDQFRDLPTLEQAVEWALLRGYQVGRDDGAREWLTKLETFEGEPMHPEQLNTEVNEAVDFTQTPTDSERDHSIDYRVIVEGYRDGEMVVVAIGTLLTNDYDEQTKRPSGKALGCVKWDR